MRIPALCESVPLAIDCRGSVYSSDLVVRNTQLLPGHGYDGYCEEVAVGGNRYEGLCWPLKHAKSPQILRTWRMPIHPESSLAHRQVFW